jgi:Lon protease-like protein
LSSTREIPIFPLGTVLFPGGMLPLRIFEQRYLEMTKVCIRDNAPFGVCLIREGHEVGTPAVPHTVGCTAHILRWDMPHLGLFHLMTEGGSVFRILEQWSSRTGLLHAQVELEPTVPEMTLPDEFQPLVALLETIMSKVGMERFPSPARLDDAAWVAYRLAESLPLEASLRQQLLEVRDPLRALDEVKAFLRSKSVTV